MRGIGWIGLVLVALGGCPYVTVDDYDARFDLDADGISRPADCDDNDAKIGIVYRFEDADRDGHGNPDVLVASCTLVDGVADIGDDCNDSNPLVSPTAEEFCNTVDDDCDADIDESDAVDALVWFLDGDRDGAGAFDAEGELSCAPLAGHVSNNADCDDGDPLVRDLVWYPDEDGDGYGSTNLAAAVLQCEAPEGAWVRETGDCLDSDPSVNPAGQETCSPDQSRALDEDCDGLVDDDDTDVLGQERFHLDADGDGRGDIHTSGTFCAAPLEDGAGEPLSWVQDDTDCDDTDPDDAHLELCPLVDITVGRDAHCAVSSSGRLLCFGDAWNVDLAPDGGFMSASAGNRHACAVDVEGGLTCWGANTDVLDGLVGAAGPFVQVSVDRNHTCATREDGAVTCWGDGINYTVSADAPYTEVEAGTHHACALRTDGLVDCFGSCSDQGECDEPDAVFSSVVAGDGFSCGVLEATGRGRCWGGRGDAAVGSFELALMSAFGDTSCALTNWGGILCWEGEEVLFEDLGDGSYVKLDVGEDEGCMIDDEGEPVCLFDYYDY
jgi:hypothetical protein